MFAKSKKMEAKRMENHPSVTRMALAVLMMCVTLGGSQVVKAQSDDGGMTGAYYDPENPGWIWDPYNGWYFSPEFEAELLGLTGRNGMDNEHGQQVVTAGGGTNHMVAVGIDHYMRASELPSCINDANGFINALTNDRARWSSANISLLTDGEATTDGIRGALYSMAARARPGDVCVFFQSSHGGQESGTSMHLTTYDGSYGDVQLGQDLGAWFADGVKIIVVVDACFSGGLFKDAAGKDIAASAISSFAQNVTSGFTAARLPKSDASLNKALDSDIAFMTASNFDETSAAGDPYSLFAGYLIEAFGANDADSNSDGSLSYLELFNWAERRTSGQSPQVSNERLLGSVIAAKMDPTNIGPLVCTTLCGFGCAVPAMLGIAMFGALRLCGIRTVSRRRVRNSLGETPARRVG